MRYVSLSGMLHVWLTVSRGQSLQQVRKVWWQQRVSVATTLDGQHDKTTGSVSEDLFLHQVETTTKKVLLAYSHLVEKDDILKLPSHAREALGIARHLNTRLQAFRRNNDCPRCWMQRAHCICSQCPPVTSTRVPIRRIFLMMHHKEIALKVDTAKLILAAFPSQCRLVIGGIGPEYQDSMQEMMDAVTQTPQQCLLLFPDDTALTCQALMGVDGTDDNEDSNWTADSTIINHRHDHVHREWDLIVLDGTWAQARKFCQRYFPLHGGPQRVQLGEEVVQQLDSTQQQGEETISGHQLRRHSITWRQIGTFEATRLFLKDLDLATHSHNLGNTTPADTISFWDEMQKYQDIANLAAQRELGPPRVH